MPRHRNIFAKYTRSTSYVTSTVASFHARFSAIPEENPSGRGCIPPCRNGMACLSQIFGRWVTMLHRDFFYFAAVSVYRRAGQQHQPLTRRGGSALLLLFKAISRIETNYSSRHFHVLVPLIQFPSGYLPCCVRAGKSTTGEGYPLWRRTAGAEATVAEAEAGAGESRGGGDRAWIPWR